MRYKKLQKISMCTTFNVTQEIFFLKEAQKLLQYVTTSCNALQKQCSPRTSLTVAQKFFFSKEGDKLLLGATASYNALQEVTKNRHVHHFQCRSRNLFSEGRGKAVAQGLV